MNDTRKRKRRLWQEAALETKISSNPIHNDPMRVPQAPCAEALVMPKAVGRSAL